MKRRNLQAAVLVVAVLGGANIAQGGAIFDPTAKLGDSL